MLGKIRIGICSWTDRTMVKAWYPPGLASAADRLRHYASHFDTVEVDSSFYGLPTSSTARLWAQRTPPDFVFHVKAFGMLTRHGVRPERVPAVLRERHQLELDRQGRIVHPSTDLREEVFQVFSEALEPLREEGKLGVMLMQFPPYFVANKSNRDYIRYSAGLLAPDRVAVEFRHASWVEPDELATTLGLLHSLGLSYVCVDEPRLDGPTALPPLTAVTSDLAYVRFHGRNASTWNARVPTAAERFRYLYSEEELAEWMGPLGRLREEANTTYVMFNNCYADYAPHNAGQMRFLLQSNPDQVEE
jgi:uncharacterized protein YecE (DUF72 family)